MNRKILFICTGNYYRSRYAELYFNLLAHQRSLTWSAFSRGLDTESSHNIGPISPRVLARLKEHEFLIDSPFRYPIQLAQADLQVAELKIALNESEHRPLMQQRFPEWTNRITYWHIPDLDQLGSKVAFPRIENQVAALLHHLPS